MTARTNGQFTIRMLTQMDQVSSSDWDGLARPLKTPLLEWQWLHQLEISGSITPETGWQPCHLTVWSNKRLVGAAPLYVKTHSLGEFVFDHSWSQIASEMDISYYPKLVGMSPVTPATGYRFLIAMDQDQRMVNQLMLTSIDQFCRQNRLSGANFLFVDPGWAPELKAFGYKAWRHQSYAWRNRNYADFDDFLKRFNANQRRNIRRERKQMVKQGIMVF